MTTSSMDARDSTPELRELFKKYKRSTEPNINAIAKALAKLDTETAKSEARKPKEDPSEQSRGRKWVR
jgi:hypothetical protein